VLKYYVNVSINGNANINICWTFQVSTVITVISFDSRRKLVCKNYYFFRVFPTSKKQLRILLQKVTIRFNFLLENILMSEMVAFL